MHLTRADDGVVYQAPGHFGVSSRRLQGHEAGGPRRAAVSISVYPPGAGVQPLPTAAETIYVVLAGELELNGHLGEQDALVLGAHDSVHLRRGEVRSLRNAGTSDAELLVVMLTDDGDDDHDRAAGL